MKFSPCILVLAAFALAGCAALERARETEKRCTPAGYAPLSAKTAPSLTGYSLEQLVSFALTNRPSVVSARLSVEDARLKLKEIAANAPLLSATPWNAAHLSLSGGHNESSAGTTLRDHDWRTSGSPSAALSLEVLVWDFGRNRAQAGAQAERVIAAERTLVEAGYEVFDDVATAYFTWCEKGALLEVSLTNVFQYAANLEQAEGRYRAGVAQELDVLKASLDLASAREDAVSCSNAVTTAGAELLYALGVEAGAGPAEKILGVAPHNLAFARQAFARSRLTLDEAYDLACTNAPSLLATRASLRAAVRDLDYAKRDLLPEISASAGLSWTDPLWLWHWGFSAAQSIFSGFSHVTAIDRARVALEKAHTEVRAAENALARDLELAVATRDDACQALATARATAARAERNYEVVSRQAAVGSASRIDLSAAVASRASALGSGVTAFYAAQMAEAKLFRLLGIYPVYGERLLPIGPVKSGGN